MKLLFSSSLALIAGLALAGCGSTAVTAKSAVSAQPVRLQMSVNLPVSRNIVWDDDIAEAFAYRVSAALHEQGLRGRIRYVDSSERLAPHIPTLAITLHEWRVDRLGSVNCVFSANLTTPSGSQSLGVFSGTSMMTWSRRDWLARQDGFEDSAQDALDNLGAKILRSGLVPDMNTQLR